MSSSMSGILLLNARLKKDFPYLNNKDRTIKVQEIWESLSDNDRQKLEMDSGHKLICDPNRQEYTKPRGFRYYTLGGHYSNESLQDPNNQNDIPFIPLMRVPTRLDNDMYSHVVDTSSSAAASQSSSSSSPSSSSSHDPTFHRHARAIRRLLLQRLEQQSSEIPITLMEKNEETGNSQWTDPFLLKNTNLQKVAAVNNDREKRLQRLRAMIEATEESDPEDVPVRSSSSSNSSNPNSNSSSSSSSSNRHHNHKSSSDQRSNDDQYDFNEAIHHLVAKQFTDGRQRLLHLALDTATPTTYLQVMNHIINTSYTHTHLNGPSEIISELFGSKFCGQL